MPEAVIVAAVRSPIGRARKGSLAGMRPDEALQAREAEHLAGGLWASTMPSL